MLVLKRKRIYELFWDVKRFLGKTNLSLKMM